MKKSKITDSANVKENDINNVKNKRKRNKAKCRELTKKINSEMQTNKENENINGNNFEVKNIWEKPYYVEDFERGWNNMFHKII